MSRQGENSPTPQKGRVIKLMGGFLDSFRQKVVHSVWADSPPSDDTQELDDKIALGVLMWVVAEADNRFLPEEKDEIRHVLKEFSAVKEEDIPLIMASIEMAAKERIDLYSFTSEVSTNLNREKKNDILKILFRIACIDKDLDLAEHEIIRTISNLFRLDHKEFIDAKIEVKKELGL